MAVWAGIITGTRACSPLTLPIAALDNTAKLQKAIFHSLAGPIGCRPTTTNPSNISATPTVGMRVCHDQSTQREQH
jgi:hypothetical protein